MPKVIVETVVQATTSPASLSFVAYVLLYISSRWR